MKNFILKISASFLVGFFILLNPALVFAGSCHCTHYNTTDSFCVDNKASLLECIQASPADNPYSCDKYFSEPSCSAVSAAAAQTSEVIKDLPAPKLQIGIPGINFSALKSAVDDKGYIHIPWIGQYLSAVYKFAVAIGSIIAVVMIVTQGIRIVVSAGGDEKLAAYRRIGQVVVGLFILWGSFVILYTLNPSLTTFEPVEVKYIRGAEIPEDDGGGASESDLSAAQETTEASLGLSGLVVIPNSATLQGNSKKTRKTTLDALNKAVELYRKNGGTIKIAVASGLRTFSEQYRIMKEKCGCKDEKDVPADVAMGAWQPHCTNLGCDAGWTYIGRKGGAFYGKAFSHTGGPAIDVSVETGSSVTCDDQSKEVKESEGAAYNSKTRAGLKCIPEEQQKFIKAMIESGFCVALKGAEEKLREPWHFEDVNAGAHISSFCTNDKNDPNLKKLYFVQN